MEMLWSKPKCDKCRHRNGVWYDPKKLGDLAAWRCDARQMAIENNKHYDRLGNCWYFEKK